MASFFLLQLACMLLGKSVISSDAFCSHTCLGDENAPERSLTEGVRFLFRQLDKLESETR